MLLTGGHGIIYSIKTSYCIDQSSLLLQRFELPNRLLKRHELSFRLCFRIVPIAYVDRPRLFLLRPHHYMDTLAYTLFTLDELLTKYEVVLL